MIKSLTIRQIYKFRYFSSKAAPVASPLPPENSWWNISNFWNQNQHSAAAEKLQALQEPKLSLNAHLTSNLEGNFDHLQVMNHSLANMDPSTLLFLKNSFICPPEESSLIIKQFQDLLVYLHDGAGLPWWSTIILVTFGFRTLLLPLNISLQRNSAKLNFLRPQLEKLAQTIDDPKSLAEEKERAAEMTVDLFKRHQCSPFRNIISPILMTPFFLSIFMAWERIIIFTPSMQKGGCLWFENLAAIDITFMLPMLSALTWIWTFRLGADRARSPQAAEFERFCSYMSLAMIPVTQTLPQGIFLYWLSSNVYSIIFMYLTQKPFVRKMLKIPPKQNSTKPYNWE